MKIIEDLEQLQQWRQALSGKTIGFVPTMGALHAGHQKLLEQSRQENEVSVLSIFVNPTQFNDPNDLSKYPKTWNADVKLAQAASVDILFSPSYHALYPDNYQYAVTEKTLSREFCGAHRPGHFDGVLTVVMKLLNLVRADRAYFGQKDYQQMLLVKGMVDAFFINTKIIDVPTVRDDDGLALSSRNQLLDNANLKKAKMLNQIIQKASSAENASHDLEQAGFAVDYVRDLQNRRLAAVRLGAVRLIDNVKI